MVALMYLVLRLSLQVADACNPSYSGD
jgi:hypothetical protein